MKDKKVRYIIVQGVLEGEDIVIVNIYAPNKKQDKFFQSLIWTLETVIKEDIIIMMGDFNSVVDTKKDKSGTAFIDEFPRNIRNWLRQHPIVDSWRFSKGDERKYTYYSNIFNSYSRIDHIWTPEKLAIRNSCGIIEIKTNFDYAVVCMSWECMNKKRNSSSWKLGKVDKL